MVGDVTLEMPTDLRPAHATESFKLESSRSRRRGITRLTVEIPLSDSSKRPGANPTQPARWRTPEFLFYGVAFCLVVPVMVWIPISLSLASHPNHGQYSSRLSEGWLFGRAIDNSDAQYRSFRSNIPILTAVAILFLTMKWIYAHFVLRANQSHSGDKLATVPFLLVLSALLLIGLHGTSVIKMLVIFLLNYLVAKTCKGSWLGPLLTWIFNAGVLLANEYQEGYHFARLHPVLESWDHFEGIYPRWHVIFNITMLRLVSFNMDYYWACKGSGLGDNGHALDYKHRIAVAHPLHIYSLQNYLTYIIYPPLYIGGPIITFNDFVWQLRRPLQTTMRQIASYLLRFLICLLTMEFILHFMYVVAIKDTKAWYGDTAAEVGLIGFWNLVIVWLKLLIPWRFFRLWALADGIDPPENMVRCVTNNYSIMGFWRSWHRSYNLWIVRYIYIPLGGSRNVIFTTVLIFSFVALWHDLSFQLLAWGWLISLFILPELAARYLLPPSKVRLRRYFVYDEMLTCAVLNNLMLMTANLVGFVVGTDGVSYLLASLFSGWEGIRFLLFSCICIFIAVQIMFEYREEEMRMGIYRRY